ncbi:hypothetical protein ACFE04_022857 [Oxalis oulophora]
MEIANNNSPNCSAPISPDRHVSHRSMSSSSNSKRILHKWTVSQDHVLVSCMVDLHRDGKYNADIGFRPGYLNELEKRVTQRLPNSKLKAKPHIESRVKTLRKDWSIVYDMLHASNTYTNNKGFCWDTSRKVVFADNSVWDAYSVTHKEFLAFRTRSLWYFEDFCPIYTKDCTKGNTPAEKTNEEGVNSEDNVDEEHESHATQERLCIDDVIIVHDDVGISVSETRENDPPRRECTSAKKKKAKINSNSTTNNSGSHINTAIVIGNEFKEAGTGLKNEMMRTELMINELVQKLDAVLGEIDGLADDERDIALSKLPDYPRQLLVFFSLPVHRRLNWVRRFILDH